MNAHRNFAPLTPEEIASTPAIAAPIQIFAPIMPIPREVGECGIRFKGRKADEKLWFRDAAGAVLSGELQWRTPGRDKQVRPCIYTSIGWRAEAPPAPRALFNLDMLAKHPEAPVYLLEGPRKAMKAAPCFGGALDDCSDTALNRSLQDISDADAEAFSEIEARRVHALCERALFVSELATGANLPAAM